MTITNMLHYGHLTNGFTGSETKGERALYYRLRDKLNDDYHVWHNRYIASLDTEIDFIILHPQEGIYVLEVKDWQIDQIKEIRGNRVILRLGEKNESMQNPLEQARNNSFAFQNGFKRDSRMRHKEGDHIGKLVTPVNFIYVLTNMSSQDIIEANLKHAFPLEKMLDQEFVKGYAYTDRDIEIALEKLRGKVKYLPVLEQEQMNAINEFLGTPVVLDPASSEVVGVFDEMQEKLVHFKIDKQILIEGPAGSGKSLVLVKRAVYLQNLQPDWEIGVFCYNKVMANYLNMLLEKEMLGHHFLVSHLQSIFPITPDIPRLDAILIDEGQDLKESDLKELFALLKKPDSPFTLFYDTRQSLYSNLDLREQMGEVGFKGWFQNREPKGIGETTAVSACCIGIGFSRGHAK